MALDGWKEKIYQRYLAWVCRPARIKRHMHALLPSPKQPAKPEPGHKKNQVRAAALQVELKLLKNPLQFADEMHRRVREAVNEEAELIVFPEYNNLPLFGLLPGFEKMEEAYREKAQNAGTGQDHEQEGEIGLADVFRYMSPVVQPLVHTVFSCLSAAYGVHIMAGSYTLAEKGNVINRSFLYGPGGLLIGSQDKVHLLPVEVEWRLKRGGSFSVFDTPLGKMAMPVCMDATYYETFRILEQKGADIVLLPIANLEDYNYWLALRGIWPRVQESCLYGIKGALVGSIAGLAFTGRAGIFAPLEITPKKDGVLAQVEPCSSEAIAVADLDIEVLHGLRRNHPWRDTNPALYRRYLPELYN